MKKIAKEFKAFITKGNVVDMAVGVIIGTAFGKIVSSLVADIIMPLITLLTGKKSFADLKWVITPADEAAGIAENALRYGSFIQFIMDFLIIALAIFLIVKIISSLREGFGKLNKKKEDEPQEPAAPTTEELLTEIRDLLKEQAAAKENAEGAEAAEEAGEVTEAEKTTPEAAAETTDKTAEATKPAETEKQE